jgi:lipoyl(octanoyl) transferase
MHTERLGLIGYRDAWALQERVHARVAEGGESCILLVEHPPVITFGRRPGVDRNLIASADQLAAAGVEIVPSDRGGDITFHGPGQLVVYPIVRLADFGLTVSGYVHRLEDAIITMLARYEIPAEKDPKAVGVWTKDNGNLAKIGAIGVRIRRGVSMHGLALNVSTDLRYFNLIVPCGLAGRPVTSMEKLLGDRCPALEAAQSAMAESLVSTLTVPAETRSAK